ncbi:MAG: GNAT family N-acetyltransferase [Pirellulales bacterium]
MPTVVVDRVVSRRDRKLFVELPWSLYRNDPNWMPPLRGNQRELLGYKPHPFHEVAEVETFLARRNGQVCGRIAAILYHGHNERYKERRGFFGFFESVDDQEVASALFDTVRDWFAQRDVRAIRGPANPSMNYECGLLIHGFDSPPFFMMTYNPPYYATLVENYGFRKAQDLFAYWGHIEKLPSVSEKLAPIIEGVISHCNITLRHLKRSRFREDVRLFLDVYNRSMENNWGFVPFTQNEIRSLSASLRHLLIPELAFTAEVDGQAVGVVVCLPDYNPRIRQIDGRLFPFGFMRLLWNRRKLKRIRVLSTNVVPEYQRWGVGLVLLSALVPKAMDWGIQEAEFSWVLESNPLARGSLEKGGAEHTKTYRMYDYEPAP